MMSNGSIMADDADEAIEASLNNITSNNEKFIRLPNRANDVAVVGSMNIHISTLERAGRRQQAQTITTWKNKFIKTASTSKRLSVAVGLRKAIMVRALQACATIFFFLVNDGHFL